MATKNNIVLVFDLDDTLYKEIDFLKSAYQEIAQVLAMEVKVSEKSLFEELIKFYEDGKNAFELILHKYAVKGLKTKDLIHIYRTHFPNIQLQKEDKDFLNAIKEEVARIGLITDGRSLQQRNKIEALGLKRFFNDLIISEEFGSEKPHVNNFKFFETRYKKNMSFIYVADNTNKDFIAPNSLGWHTICLLDNGKNIHKQKFSLPNDYLPKDRITKLSEIANTLTQLEQMV